MMTIHEDPNHLFDSKLRKYEDNLVELLLDIAQQKRVNRKLSTISSYLLIHERLTQKELKELTGFSMGSVSTFLSVMTGTGAIQKERIPHTHTFMYSIYGKLEILTTRAIEVALRSLDSIGLFLKNKNEILKKLIGQSKKGAKHLSQRIDELIESFEIYKKIFSSEGILSEEIQKQYSTKSSERSKYVHNDVKEIRFDEEVYLIESDIINQLLASPMFSTRDPMFIRILGYFMTRKYLTQKTLKRITGLSSGKISEEVNQLLKDKLIYKAEISPKGKITYGADSLIILRFSRYILNRMTKWVKDLENIKLDLENDSSELENLDGFAQIYKIYDYILGVISKYSGYAKKIDNLIELY